MVDIFALAISHGLLALAAWRLVWRSDLDSDDKDAGAPRFARRAKMAPAEPGAQGDA